MSARVDRTNSEMTLSPSTPSSIEKGEPDRQRYILQPHTSTLPTWLYILSFAPPLPSPWRKPKEFVNNPKFLYFVGTIGACIAGVGLPAFDIVTGWWTNYVKDDRNPPGLILRRGEQAGYIMAIIGVVYLFAFTLMNVCCKYFPRSIGQRLLSKVTTAGIKLSGHVRERYLASIMVQDQAFFDRVGAGEVVSRSSRDIDSIRTGLGERLGYLIWGTCTIIAVSSLCSRPFRH